MEIKDSMLEDIVKDLLYIKTYLNDLGQKFKYGDNVTYLETQSDDVGQIYAALAKAQGEYKDLKPNERSSEGKLYANLSAILSATREALSKNLLTFTQQIKLLDEGSGAALLITKLGHASGEWLASYTRVIAGKTDSATGNSQEIHKRLQALMLLGIAPSFYDPIAHDDDGVEQNERRLTDELLKPKSKRDIDRTVVITKDRYDEINKELALFESQGDADYLLKKILETHSIQTLADLPDEVYPEVITQLRNVRIRALNQKANYLQKR